DTSAKRKGNVLQRVGIQNPVFSQGMQRRKDEPYGRTQNSCMADDPLRFCGEGWAIPEQCSRGMGTPAHARSADCATQPDYGLHEPIQDGPEGNSRGGSV